MSGSPNNSPTPPENPAGPVLHVENVSFDYPGGIAALADVSLSLAAGEFLAVVGANGSGKTTLMKVLLRLLKPKSGRVLLTGRDIAALPAAELYASVGMVFQNPTDQLFAPTVEQDVAFGPRNLGLPEAQVRQRVAEALAAVDAAALADRPIHRLSFGEQKRVCLAGALAMQPRTLVLDEPTAGLDPAAEAGMIDLLRRLNREQHISMILSTHVVDLLAGLADRVCVLARGHVARIGPTPEVLTDRDGAAQAGLRLPLIAQLFDGLDRDGSSPSHCNQGREGRGKGLPRTIPNTSTDPPSPSNPRLPMTVEEGRKQILAWLANPDRRPPS
jgi:cobalt/nickel transport system ATP-binding protein